MRGYTFLEKYVWVFSGRGSGEVCDSETSKWGWYDIMQQISI